MYVIELYIINDLHVDLQKLPARIPYVKMHSIKFGLNAVARQPMVVRIPSRNMAVRQLHLSMMILDTGPAKIQSFYETIN